MKKTSSEKLLSSPKIIIKGMKEMKNIVNLYTLGKQLYKCDRWINYRFIIVFIIRSLMHPNEVQTLYDFFHSSPLRRKIITTHPTFFAQLTRHLFFKASTTSERLAIIIQSFVILEYKFTKQSLQQIYLGPGIRLWSQWYKEHLLSIDMGLAAVNLGKAR
ncbi:MAG: hypothetical protein H6Q67_985 [Firmicutes bacterium]|nr:hypothetical protein [Bacillota bacterium]